jgi:hypothetical protein
MSEVLKVFLEGRSISFEIDLFKVEVLGVP